MSLITMLYLYYSFSSFFTGAILTMLFPALVVAGFEIGCVIFDERDALKRAREYRWVVVAFLILAFLSSFIPDEDEMKILIGAYGIQELSQVEGVSELPVNVVGAMNDFLKSIGEESK